MKKAMFKKREDNDNDEENDGFFKTMRRAEAVRFSRSLLFFSRWAIEFPSSSKLLLFFSCAVFAVELNVN